MAEDIPFKEKIQSIRFSGQGMRVPHQKVVDGKKHVEIVDEEDGSTAGYEIHHGSGRQDAVAKLKPAAPLDAST